MDPVVRAVKEIRRLKSTVNNPFNKEELTEYFCEMGRGMGFSVVKNYKRYGAKALCAWVDGHNVIFAVNAEFGSTREILGAAAELIVIGPDVCALVTASNPMKRIDDVLNAVDVLAGKKPFVILDVNGVRSYIVGG